MKTVLFVFFNLSFIFVNAQINYQWFNKAGKKVDFEEVYTTVSKSQLILFGELHDNQLAHQFQLELGKKLFILDSGALIFGSEMFERHQTEQLARYLNDGDVGGFEKSTELWSNFRTDYFPLLEFAHKNHVPFIATNCSRKYANLVFKFGQDTLQKLNTTEVSNLCPLPFQLNTTGSQYEVLLKMGNEMGGKGANFAAAQSIKDATMGWFIVQNLEPGKRFLHLNGSFHSDYFQSICFYVQLYAPKTTLTTISVIESKRLKKIKKSELNRADFILVTKPTTR